MSASVVALLLSNPPDVSAPLRFLVRAMGGPALRSWLSGVFAVGVLLLPVQSVCAETGALMHALSFALAGNDNADVKVIGDRASCVFAVKNELFRLNNVYADRIEIQGRQRQWLGALEQWVAITLQGDEIVFEETVDPPKDDGSELMRQMRVESPEMFKSHHYSYTRYELHLATNDQDRVKTAWQYIYSHGCTGKRTP